MLQPAIFPAFQWPEANACSRGWQVLRWSGVGEPAIQFSSISVDQTNFGDQEVFTWTNLPEADNDALTDPAANATGTRAPIDSGALSGWDVKVNGWTDIPNVGGTRSAQGEVFVGAAPDHRLVAVHLDVCAGERGALPGFGLALDGWHLASQFRRGTPWATGFEEINLPVANECASGWLAFEAPADTNPTGFFLTDPNDPTAPWVRWTLDATAPLPQPDADGFPTAKPGLERRQTCGFAGDRLELDLRSTVAQSWLLEDALTVESAIAVERSDGSTEIYVADHQVSASGLPIPAAPDDYMVVVRADLRSIEIGADAAVPLTVAATVALVRGDIGGYLFFDDVEVELLYLSDDVICGQFVMGASSDAAEWGRRRGRGCGRGCGWHLSGAFAAPRWTGN